ncbi:MAG: RNA-binding protein [Clostridia bacterium]|nr:RNA-binding protein [Clostridia bacterium]
MAGFGVTAEEKDLFPLACLRISPLGAKFAGDMSHRDVLGSLMSLGFERSLLGDIILREKEAWVFCAERIADFICDSLSSVRHTSIKAVRVSAPPAGELFRTRREVIQVASERMDALVAHAFQLSRGNAQSLFSAGKVFLDGAECLRTDAEPREGQIISVRGMGRFRYLGAESRSKKGKWNTVIERYV